MQEAFTFVRNSPILNTSQWILMTNRYISGASFNPYWIYNQLRFRLKFMEYLINASFVSRSTLGILSYLPMTTYAAITFNSEPLLNCLNDGHVSHALKITWLTAAVIQALPCKIMYTLDANTRRSQTEVVHRLLIHSSNTRELRALERDGLIWQSNIDRWCELRLVQPCSY